jgi:iron complex transport system ATP-binding protein
MDTEVTVQEPDDPRAGAIVFKDVSGGYGRVSIFKNMSFTIREGTMTSIIGPNGSGKTTLLRAATGLLDHVSGQVRLFGKAIRSLPARERAAMIGVVPQEVHTPMAYSVEEIVTMGRTHAISRWGGISEADRKIVEQSMIYTDVADMRDRPFPELSGGERQRVIIAMVLAQQPRIILMDEATSHLDINHRLEVMQLIERLNRERGVTVLMVSHDLNLASEFCDRLLLIDKGRLVADGMPSEVLTESALRQVYHCDVKIEANPQSGSVMVVPSPRLVAGQSARGMRLHVVAGGGCGEEVLRRLCLCDYAVSCGVLNSGDRDATTALALELDVALEKPFSPVGGEAFIEAERLASESAAIVVCGVPFGPGNVVNLELAERMQGQGIPVFLMAGIESRDYTPEGKAGAIAARLREGGAKEWESIADLLRLLPGMGECPDEGGAV